MAKQIKVLIISYFFSPDKRVGALRTSYWFRHLPENSMFDVKVITANTEASGDNVSVVPNEKVPGPFSPIKDAGTTWKKELKKHIKTNNISADVVIISGSPFMHFGLSKWLKSELNCKVILDYRDPFAINPGFNNSKIKVFVKQLYEKYFNQSADALVTVNKYCARIISGFEKKPNAIIQNGFDETVQPSLKKVDLKQPTLCYTGKFYFDPTPLLMALKANDLTLNYAGLDGDLVKEYKESVVDFGLVKYPKAVSLIANSDIAIIQTLGEDFQSTTKLFDYIRCGRPILVISNRHIQRGSIHDELKGYPNVFWSKNDSESIIKAIDEIRNTTYIEPDSTFCESFSREKQMTKLIDLILKIK